MSCSKLNDKKNMFTTGYAGPPIAPSKPARPRKTKRIYLRGFRPGNLGMHTNIEERADVPSNDIWCFPIFSLTNAWNHMNPGTPVPICRKAAQTAHTFLYEHSSSVNPLKGYNRRRLDDSITCNISRWKYSSVPPKGKQGGLPRKKTFGQGFPFDQNYQNVIAKNMTSERSTTCLWLFVFLVVVDPPATNLSHLFPRSRLPQNLSIRKKISEKNKRSFQTRGGERIRALGPVSWVTKQNYQACFHAFSNN